MKIQPKFNPQNIQQKVNNQPSFGMRIQGKERLNLALVTTSVEAVQHCMGSNESHLNKKANLKRVSEEFEKLKAIVNSAMESIGKYNETNSEHDVNAIIDQVKIVKNPVNGDLQLNLHIDNQIFIPISTVDSNIAEKIQNVIIENAARLN